MAKVRCLFYGCTFMAGDNEQKWLINSARKRLSLSQPNSANSEEEELTKNQSVPHNGSRRQAETDGQGDRETDNLLIFMRHLRGKISLIFAAHRRSAHLAKSTDVHPVSEWNCSWGVLN